MLPRERLCRHRRAGVLALQQRQTGRDERPDPRRVVHIVEGSAPDVALVSALEEVQPARVVLRELGDPAALVDVRVQVQVPGGDAADLVDPRSPLALCEVAVEVHVDSLLGQFAHNRRVQPDRPAGHDSVERAVGRGQTRRADRGEPLALRQVAVEHQRPAIAQARRDGEEPLAHLGARVDLAVGARVQIDELRPDALLQGNERRLVLIVDRGVLGSRHRIVRIAIILRILVDDAGLRVLLPGQVLELGHTRVGILVGVVDHRRRLIHLRAVRLVDEAQRAIGQLAEAIVEEGVDRPGVDHLTVGDDVEDLPVVGVEHDLDVRMIEHALEHAGVAMQRHRLVRVGKVAIVAVGAHRHARRDRRVELRWIQAPLLAGVAAKELLIQLAPNLADHNVLGCANLRARLGQRLQKVVHLEGGQVEPVELVDRIEIDRDGHKHPVDAGAHAVLVWPPGGELRQVVEDRFGVGVKDVRAISVDQQAVVVVVVVGVAADMGAGKPCGAIRAHRRNVGQIAGSSLGGPRDLAHRQPSYAKPWPSPDAPRRPSPGSRRSRA